MRTVYDLKREVEKPVRLTGGHRLCAGCGAGVVVAGILRALDKEDREPCVHEDYREAGWGSNLRCSDRFSRYAPRGCRVASPHLVIYVYSGNDY